MAIQREQLDPRRWLQQVSGGTKTRASKEDPNEKNDLSKDKERVKEVNARLQTIRGRMKEYVVREE